MTAVLSEAATEADTEAPPEAGPLRVLHVINMGTLCGGAERQVADLVARQRAAGHQVRVLSSDLAGAGARFSDETWPQEAPAGALGRLAGRLRNPAARACLAGAVERWRPDVVHLHTVGLLSPAALGVLAGTPTVLTVHGPEVYVRDTEQWCLPDRYIRSAAGDHARLTWRGRAAALCTTWLIGRRWRRELRVVDLFLAPSRYVAGLLDRDFGPTRIVPNGRAGGPPGAVAPAVRRGGPTLLFVGRLERFKGVEVLVEAVALLRARHPGVRLTVAGSGSTEQALRRRVDELGLADRVELVGWLDPPEVERRLAAADVAVVPSLWPEAFGLACLEALAAGTPVVASAVGGLPDLVRHEATGLLVPPGDAPALAAAVHRLVTDHALRDRVVEAGRRLVDGYSLEAHAAAVDDSYREAVDRHRTRPPAAAAASLLRNSAMLLLATVQLAAGGFLFWQIVAHLFSPEQVGRASALISTATLVGNLALLGMNNAAIRYLPGSADPARTVNTGLGVVVGAALVGSLAFAAVTGRGAAELAALAGLTVVGAASLYYDNVFVALRRSGYVLGRNTAVVLARLAVPAFAVGLGALGIFVAYWAAVAVALPVYLMGLRRWALSPRLAVGTDLLREMWRYAAGNYLATAILMTPGLLMPAVVAHRLGPDSAAYYYIASLVASVLLFVPQAVGRSLFAELAHEPARTREHLLRVLKATAAIQVPLLCVVIGLGRPLLGLFGAAYGRAYPALALIAVTAALSSVGYVGSTMLLVSGQIRLLCALSAVTYGSALVAAYLVADRGLAWIASALLAGEVLLALGYIPVLIRAARGGGGG